MHLPFPFTFATLPSSLILVDALAAEEPGVSAGTEPSGVDELPDGAEVAGNSEGVVSPVNISSDRVEDGVAMIQDNDGMEERSKRKRGDCKGSANGVVVLGAVVGWLRDT